MSGNKELPEEKGTPNTRGDNNCSSIICFTSGRDNNNPGNVSSARRPLKDPPARRKSILKRNPESGTRGGARPSVSFASEKEVVTFRVMDKDDDDDEPEEGEWYVCIRTAQIHCGGCLSL